MLEARSHEFNGADLTRLGTRQEAAVITVGHSRKGRLYALPLATWHKQVGDVYGFDTVASAPRVNTSTNPDGMTEPVLMEVLVNQVGEDGSISGGSICVLTLRNDDAAVLVPANAYWKNAVEGKEGQ